MVNKGGSEARTVQAAVILCSCWRDNMSSHSARPESQQCQYERTSREVLLLART